MVTRGWSTGVLYGRYPLGLRYRTPVAAKERVQAAKTTAEGLAARGVRPHMRSACVSAPGSATIR